MKLFDIFTRWRSRKPQEAEQAEELAPPPPKVGKPQLKLIVSVDRGPALMPKHGKKPTLQVIEGGVAVRAQWPAPAARAG